MHNANRIAELEGQLAQTRVRLTASRALYKEATERLKDAEAERDHYRNLAAAGADTIIAMCEAPEDTIDVPRRDLLLAQYHLSHSLNIETQDLAERFAGLLQEEANHAN